jgi:hypothetical protein
VLYPPERPGGIGCVDKAWRECPEGAHPILVGDLNVKLRAPRTEREETIAEQVDAMDLVDMSRHFCHRSGKRLRGRWTWRMRREGRWISSQCDYFLGRETDRRRFWRVSVRMPRYHSDHRALVAVIYAEGGGGIKAVPTEDAAISPFPPQWPSDPARCWLRGATAACGSPPSKGAPRQQLDL